MNKICTSIEQSKKLIELGIDRKTSDMYYWCGEDLRIGGYKAQDEEYDVSAWSLSALLDLMPVYGYYPELCRGRETHLYYMWIEDTFDTQTFDNPIDAAFEMVCWILENKKI